MMQAGRKPTMILREQTREIKGLVKIRGHGVSGSYPHSISNGP
jgi:hypothetical protein